jgi:5'-phosphate synthase pdxT subunit
MKIGVLALQGDFLEHIQMLQRLGVEAVEVRLPKHLDGLDGLIIPGGRVYHDRQTGRGLWLA